MDTSGRSMELDIVGRVMSLEQKTRGLYGRVGAMEMRLSMEPGELAVFDNTEFVSGEHPHIQKTTASLEERISALESSLHEKKHALTVQKISVLDVTGIVIGLSMLAVGALLATDSVDILRNPLLAFAVGIIILACAVGRLLLK